MTKSAERHEFLNECIITFVEGRPYSWFDVRDYKFSLPDAGGDATAKVRVNRSEECDRDVNNCYACGTDTWDCVDCDADPNGECEAHAAGCMLNGPWTFLGVALIAKGFGVLKKGPVKDLHESTRARLLGASAINDAGELDINDVDVVMQCALLGEVVYG